MVAHEGVIGGMARPVGRWQTQARDGLASDGPNKDFGWL
jgi:hypothetical protein